jgi:hypothetical protein
VSQMLWAAVPSLTLPKVSLSLSRTHTHTSFVADALGCSPFPHPPKGRVCVCVR